MNVRISGGEIQVDEADLPLLERHRWRISRSKRGPSYAVASVCGRRIFLHRLILGAPEGVEVDHKNRDGLDNTRSNLRLSSRSKNAHNVPKRGQTSKYRGVYWNFKDNRWHAKIRSNSSQKFLGCFRDEVQAAKAYDAAARAIHGGHAVTNF